MKPFIQIETANINKLIKVVSVDKRAFHSHEIFSTVLTALLAFSFSFLTSCTFFGQKKKAIVAEIFCEHNYYSADAKALQKNNAVAVNRVKKLIMNEELLNISIEKSEFNHTVEEVKEALSFENPENTTIIEIHYSANEIKGATTFLDTLLSNLIRFDIRNELQRSERAIQYTQFRLDSVSVVLEQLKNDSVADTITVKNEDLYIELLQRRASLVIEKAAIVPKIKILSWAREEL